MNLVLVRNLLCLYIKFIKKKRLILLNKHPIDSVSYTHLRAHETDSYLVCRLLLEKKKYAVFCLKKKNSFFFFFFLMIRRQPRSTHCISSAASDVYKRQTLYNTPNFACCILRSPPRGNYAFHRYPIDYCCLRRCIAAPVQFQLKYLLLS